MTPGDTVQNNNNRPVIVQLQVIFINKNCKDIVRNPDVELKNVAIWMQKRIVKYLCLSFELVNPAAGILG